MSADVRSAQDVLEEHLRLRAAGELDLDIDRNYADDVVVLTCSGTWRGKQGVREQAAALAREVQAASYEYDVIVVDGEVGMLEWRAHDGDKRICDGVDSYVIREGCIVAQTIHYTVSTD
jgi:hypothetical protein